MLRTRALLCALLASCALSPARAAEDPKSAKAQAPAQPTAPADTNTPAPAPKPAPAAPQGPATAPTTAPSSAASTVEVRAFGAKGDGTSDDTAAFRAAMAAVGAKGGVVSVPAGDYLIKTHLDIPPAVTLEGVWRSPTARTQRLGTTLLAVEGAGAEAGAAFISLGANATLRGITVFYPEQKPDKITPYPWCVAAAGENVSVIDCLLLNPYQGLDLASKPSGRHYVRNVYGQPLRRGVSVDKCFDVGRIENVHFGPFWNWDDPVQKWQTANGEAFTFARSDWQYVRDTFCYGYRVGYRFVKSADGATNGNLLGIGADATHTAVSIEATQGPALLIGNGQFVSFIGDKPTHVVVGDAHGGVVQFQNCAFWGLSYQVARIAGTGAISFNNCNFVEWSNGTPAIDLSGGDLIVNGCVFEKPFPQAVLQNKAQSAVITSNRLAGPLGIANPANANLQQGFNVEKKPAP
jgi:hypothetical protein